MGLKFNMNNKMSDDYMIIVDGNIDDKKWSNTIICDECGCIYRVNKSKLFSVHDKYKGKFCLQAFCPCCKNTSYAR